MMGKSVPRAELYLPRPHAAMVRSRRAALAYTCEGPKRANGELVFCKLPCPPPLHLVNGASVPRVTFILVLPSLSLSSMVCCNCRCCSCHCRSATAAASIVAVRVKVWSDVVVVIHVTTYIVKTLLAWMRWFPRFICNKTPADN